jgi:hypothetical protein
MACPVLSHCQFAVPAAYSYNAEGGGGTGTVQQLGNNKLQLTFDAQGKQMLPRVTVTT